MKSVVKNHTRHKLLTYVAGNHLQHGSDVYYHPEQNSHATTGSTQLLCPHRFLTTLINGGTGLVLSVTRAL